MGATASKSESLNQTLKDISTTISANCTQDFSTTSEYKFNNLKGCKIGISDSMKAVGDCEISSLNSTLTETVQDASSEAIASNFAQADASAYNMNDVDINNYIDQTCDQNIDMSTVINIDGCSDSDVNIDTNKNLALQCKMYASADIVESTKQTASAKAVATNDVIGLIAVCVTIGLCVTVYSLRHGINKLIMIPAENLQFFVILIIGIIVFITIGILVFLQIQKNKNANLGAFSSNFNKIKKNFCVSPMIINPNYPLNSDRKVIPDPDNEIRKDVCGWCAPYDKFESGYIDVTSKLVQGQNQLKRAPACARIPYQPDGGAVTNNTYKCGKCGDFSGWDSCNTWMLDNYDSGEICPTVGQLCNCVGDVYDACCVCGTPDINGNPYVPNSCVGCKDINSCKKDSRFLINSGYEGEFKKKAKDTFYNYCIKNNITYRKELEEHATSKDVFALPLGAKVECSNDCDEDDNELFKTAASRITAYNQNFYDEIIANSTEQQYAKSLNLVQE